MKLLLVPLACLLLFAFLLFTFVDRSDPHAWQVQTTSATTVPPLPAVSTMRPGVTVPTTTTAPPRVVLVPKARTAPKPTATSVSGYPCGGDLPPCIDDVIIE